MDLESSEASRLHWTVRSFLALERLKMHVSWKLLEVARNFLAGYREIYLATQLIQELPTTWSMLDFARELHQCLSRAFQTDPDAMVFVLTTVSITRKGETIHTPLFNGLSGDQPPDREINVDSDPEIDLGPKSPDGSDL